MFQRQLDQSVKDWKQTSTSYKTSFPKINLQEKNENENKVEQVLKEMSKQMKRLAHLPLPRNRVKKEFLAYTEEILDKSYPFRFESFKKLIDEGFYDLTLNFLSKAKNYDGKLTDEVLVQSLRNVWVMGMIQYLFGEKVELTPTILAYSLLYPYGDNYLDDPTIAPEDKTSFSQRFKQALFYGKSNSTSKLEEKMSYLASIIRDEFPPRSFPDLYQNFDLLLGAQEESVTLQNKNQPKPTEEIINITFSKGGITLLTNGMIALKRDLTDKEMQWLYNFGAAFQMIDDLQDLEEDIEDYSETLFTHLDKAGKIFDDIVEKLKNFIIENNNKSAPNTERTAIIIPFVQEFCMALIDEAIAQNQTKFSETFLAGLEDYYPVRLDYLANTVDKLFASIGENGLTTLINALV